MQIRGIYAREQGENISPSIYLPINLSLSMRAPITSAWSWFPNHALARPPPYGLKCCSVEGHPHFHGVAATV